MFKHLQNALIPDKQQISMYYILEPLASGVGRIAFFATNIQHVYLVQVNINACSEAAAYLTRDLYERGGRKKCFFPVEKTIYINPKDLN